jgi:hypothetical protein
MWCDPRDPRSRAAACSSATSFRHAECAASSGSSRSTKKTDKCCGRGNGTPTTPAFSTFAHLSLDPERDGCDGGPRGIRLEPDARPGRGLASDLRCSGIEGDCRYVDACRQSSSGEAPLKVSIIGSTSAAVVGCTGLDPSPSDPIYRYCRWSSTVPAGECTGRGRCPWHPTRTSLQTS